MAQIYNKHEWSTKEPITKAKMQNIEDGIKALDSLTDTNFTKLLNYVGFTDSDLNSGNILTRLNNLFSIVGYDLSEVNQDGSIKQRIENLGVDSSKVNQNSTNIGKLLTIINNACGEQNIDDANLQAVLQAIRDRFDPTKTEVENAKGSSQSLTLRLNTLDSTISDINNDISDLAGEISNAHRDGSDTLDNRFDDIENEINGAHNSSISGDTIGSRFNRVEQAIGTFRDIIGQENNTVPSDWVDMKTQLSNINSELNASHSSETTSTSYNSLDERLEGIETLIGSKETNLNESISNLDARLDKIDGGSALTGNSTLAVRVGTIETEITNAKDTYDSIDARFDAVEDKANAAAVASTVNNALDGLDGRLTTVESDLNTASTGLKAKVGALETTVGDNSAGLVKRVSDAETAIGSIEDSIGTGFNSTHTISAAIANKADSSALNSKADISTVNAISTTIVLAKTEVNFDADNKPTTLVSGTIVDKDDYLIQSPVDDKYYYWKHIDNEWHLMGGTGNSNGGGNSSGFVYTAEAYEELEEKEANTDYYVLESDGYHHYRWVNNEEIEIVEPNTKYNIAIESVESDGTTINYLNLYEFHPGDDTTIDDNTVLDTLLTKRIRHILLPATGGGGGGIVNNMKITPITARNMYIAYGSNLPAKIRFFFTTGEANEPVNYNILINGESILSEPVNITSGDPINKAYTWPVDENTGEELSPADAAALGFYEVDIADYCKAIGTYTVKLVIALDSNLAITSESNWTVRTINLSLTSNYTNNPVVEVGSNLVFNYIPSGNIEKVAHFVLNNTELPSVTLEAKVNTTQNYTIPAQMVAGAYKLKVYLTANNGAIETDPIYRDIIWQDSNSSDIIIASPYRGNTENIQQYNTLNIPYTIIGGTGSTYNVKYYVDDFSQSINEVTLTNTNNGTWTYHANDSGNHTLKIECEETSITINLVVRPLDIDIAPVTANLAIDFNPSGITNTSSKRLWSNDNYSMTVSDNFDWYNGGYGSDAAGDYFLIKAGTRATFDYKMFKSYNRTIDGAVTTSSTVFRDGLEMKLIFKTSAVRNAEAVWFTNVGPTNDTSAAKNVGIQLNVHNGWLKTDAAEEGNTKSYLYFPYSEEDRIELDININPETATNAVYLMSYEDGCPSRAYPYKTSEALYQINNEESPIVIGSDDCDVYIYRFKIYNAALDTEDVLRNFIADGKDVSTCLERYERNSIYYDTQNEEYSPYMGPDCVLDPVKLAYKIPDVKILMLDAPTFTVNKKTFIKDSTLRCIHAPGGKVYPSRGKEDNWFFGNGYHAGQGTTSDKYGDAGRNIDFLFNCDGIHKPSDKVNPIENYVSYVIKGYGTDEQEEPEYCADWKGNTGKVSLTATSVPNNFFNLKVNIASSENVNNALFQKRYNDFLLDLFESLAYKRDNRIKNDMEFVPAILFVRENDSVTSIETVDNQEIINYPNHKEFNDMEWHFYALGNIGDSKKTDYTRAYDPTDINEFTLEISDNNTNNSQFQTGVYMKNGVRTIEPYEVVQDKEDDGTLKDTYSAKSLEEDITVETTSYLYPIDKETEWEAIDPETGEYKNMRYWGLMNEKFDGDHSFEMRYACEGNYRDGKLVNDTHGASTVPDGKGGFLTKDKYQLELNTKVWQAFYTWLITCTDEQFVNELDLWCVRQSVAYFFAFTQYYTMIDNRAKNTFWHFAKTGTMKPVPIGRAVPELMHIYQVSDGNEGYTPATGTFNNQTQYYTEYAFDMWAYDMDTAAGIDNNGELIFPYGKEDTDYRIDGDPSSGMVFNGAGSVFWARLRRNCNSDIVNAFTGVSSQCFNAENLITEFDKVQNCYPEAIWRLDVERKYIRPFTGDKGTTAENPHQEIYLTRQNTRFLGDMMQGRKKYQRRQWVKDQGVYFGSKYKLSNITSNQCDMVCYTIANQNVKANWDLTITPYQDMYINVEYGETVIPPIRAKANVPVEVDCPFTSMNETRVRIYGSDYIRTIAGKPIKDENDNIIGADGLASFYFRGNDFSHINKLRELYIGSSDPTYSNSQFVTLNLPKNTDIPILEVLDIQNCDGLSGALDLSRATAIKQVEAQGTLLSQVLLPSSTNAQILHLPSTINRLVLTAAKNLQELTIRTKTGLVNDVSNLTELIVNDSDYSNSINWMNIASNALSHLSNLQLIELKKASIVNISAMESFAERKSVLGSFINESGEEVSRINLSGIITVTGSWSTIEVSGYRAVWNNNINFDTSNGTEQTKWAVTYKYDNYSLEDGTVIVGDNITTIYVNDGAQIPDIYSTGIISIPHRDSTVRYNYIFGTLESGEYIPLSGWKVQGRNISIYEMTDSKLVRSNMVIETYFTTETRRYPVKWYLNRNDESSLVRTSASQVLYGGGETLEAPTVAEIHSAGKSTVSVNVTDYGATVSIFNGWEKLPVNITPTIDDDSYNIYALWDTRTVTFADLFADTTNLTPEQLLVYSRMTSTQRNTYAPNITTSSRFTYTLGQDSVEEGTILVGPNNTLGLTNDVLRLDLATSQPIVTNIKPLSNANDAFTIVFDYCFNTNTEYSNVNAAILASCYYQNTVGNNKTVSGFGLYYNCNSNLGPIGPRVGFGDMFTSSAYSVPVGNSTNAGDRNIVVLRHPAGSPVLYVYSGLVGSTALSSTVVAQQISWNNIKSEAFLNFGQLTDSEDLEYYDLKNGLARAQGTIYYAKYWDKDLGIGECKKLAAWPHESMTYCISGITNSITNGTPIVNNPVPSIGITSLTSSAHGRVAQPGSSGLATVGWGTSAARTICNGVLFEGLPTKLQSIINRPLISYYNAISSSQDGITSYSRASTTNSQNDYIYLPSVSNLQVNGTYSSEVQQTYDISPYEWIDDINVSVYDYDSTSSKFILNPNASRSKYMNLRFAIKPIGSQIRIFRTTLDITGERIYTLINNSDTDLIRTGDIFIQEYADNNIAYMYVSNADIRNLGVQRVNNIGIFQTTDGGWLASNDYWTRSMTFDNNRNTFAYVTKTGTVITSNNNQSDARGLYLSYSFSI